LFSEDDGIGGIIAGVLPFAALISLLLRENDNNTWGFLSFAYCTACGVFIFSIAFGACYFLWKHAILRPGRKWSEALRWCVYVAAVLFVGAAFGGMI